MAKRKKAIRKVTVGKKAELNRLAEILYEFLPLSSRSKSAVTFVSIFSESSIEHYLEGPENKLQALEKGFTNVYRYHDRLPKILIRKIIPASINYRNYQRRPLKKAEVDELVSSLSNLGIDMKKELNKIKIDETLPRIKIPPAKLKERLRMHDLDPAIYSEPLQLFEDGYFNEAVRKAMERFEDRVQDLSGIDSSGRDLMARSFSDGTHINVTGVETENQLGFIDGYKLMTMGSMASIRNIFSHGNEERRSPEECFEMLMFINWLYRFLNAP